MEIFIISDTHAPKCSGFICETLLRESASANLILHAGDVGCPEFLDKLDGMGVEAVCGNSDPGDVAARLRERKILRLGGRLTLGLIHGWGLGGSAPQNARSAFPEGLNILVYGHTHVQSFTWVGLEGGRPELWICPGAFGPRHRDEGPGWARLTIDFKAPWGPCAARVKMGRFKMEL